ncbi:MAG: DUF4038 domain-containing protein [Christensenellales bacterium]|jgi:hypothetical protein
MVQIEQNRVAEVALRTAKAYQNPMDDVSVFARVTDPAGVVLRVPGFWAGGGVWKFRYSSDQVGVHSYITESNDPELGGARGEIRVEPYAGDNPLYLRGAIGRRRNDLYLTHRDGTPFFWLGDTWWMGLTTRLSWPDDFQTLTADRVEKGYNVVQIVAGLYPDMLPFDERGANEAGFPWDEQFTAINPAYFDAADQKIAWLAENGIVPCIVGCWGFFMRFAGKDVIKRHWQYLIVRWGAYPVAWCLAGEANMTFYGDQSVPMEEHLKTSRRDWNDIARFVRDADPFRRLVTIHPTQNGHEQIEDETLLDLDMLQTGHGSFLSLAPTMRQVSAAVSRKKHPVINSEVCYEGICNSSYADVQRYLFWSNLMLGVCGFTYGANGIWQLNTAETPYGVSPHGAHWGDTPWTEAYRLPGSFQIGAAKKLWTKYEWWNFEPRPDWIDKPCSLDALDGAFASGIPGKVRIIFRPFWGGSAARQVLGLEPNIRYRARQFNPVTGETRDLGIVDPSPDGAWLIPAGNAFQDWATVLEAE